MRSPITPWCRIVVLAGALLGPWALADQVTNLYEAEVRVTGKSVEERDTALARGLLSVVVKVSGNRAAGGNPAIAGALGDPARYLQQFLYRSGATPQGGADALTLWARFDPGAVDGLIRDAGMPIWGRVRPSVLALVAVESATGRSLLAAEDTNSWSRLMQGAAGERGIPLVLPLMDLQDREDLRVSDVWAGFEDGVRAAAGRYQSEAVLLGRVRQVVPGSWEGRWQMILGGGRQEWVSRGETMESVLLDGVGESADLLVARFAGYTATAGATGVPVTVTGVRTLRDYARALRYLGSLDAITRLEVTRVEPDRLFLEVDARGGREGVRQVIGLGRILSEEGQSDWTSGLSYRLMP